MRKTANKYIDERLIDQKYFIFDNYEIEIDERGGERHLNYINSEDGVFAITNR